MTRTGTQTLTPSPTPTGTATVAPGLPAVNINQIAGRPGGIACVGGTLVSSGNPVGATSNDLSYDASRLTWNTCTINPAIGPSSAANKQLTSTALGPGLQRVDVGGALPNTIPDGTLYGCEVDIDASAPLGAIPLGNTPTAFDAAGDPIAGTGGTAGQVVVTLCSADCDGNGHVTIGELTRCVNAFLGRPLCDPAAPAQSCPVADINHDRHVSIGELTNCVNRFLNGCP